MSENINKCFQEQQIFVILEIRTISQVYKDIKNLQNSVGNDLSFCILYNPVHFLTFKTDKTRWKRTPLRNNQKS